LLCAGLKCCRLGSRVLAFTGQDLSEPNPVYKVGFIREKGKATAREVQRSPETGGWVHR
jgi:hypothetical protein